MNDQQGAIEVYSWFLIMCSWEPENDEEAIGKFGEVYKYLIGSQTKEWDDLDVNDPRKAIDPDSLKALNLIGKRKFVIIGRSMNNEVLQKLSSMITLKKHIKVDVYAATDVTEFRNIAGVEFPELLKNQSQ